MAVALEICGLYISVSSIFILCNHIGQYTLSVLNDKQRKFLSNILLNNFVYESAVILNVAD